MERILNFAGRSSKVRRIFGLSKFVLHKSALHEVGWFRSCKERLSVDKEGNPIPWINYASIDFLTKRAKKNMSVFEFGAGYSTIWWAKRVKDVVSVEHDKAWIEKLTDLLPKNSRVIYSPEDTGYENSVNKINKKFNVIVIDGMRRNECAPQAVKALSKDGVIVWDNTDRTQFDSGIRHLTNLGFKRIDFFGLPPVDNDNYLTSIFYKKDNCFEI